MLFRSQRLAALVRLAEQLHPERPLQRGYAMVLDADGKAVTSRASAQRKAMLAIRFADGELEVVPAGAQPVAPARRAAAPKRESPDTGQAKLL